MQDAGEYQEQRDFARQVLALLEQLPAVPGRESLVQNANALIRQVDAKAPGQEVSVAARARPPR